ncbi:hypothetical protein MPSEU_000414300 [Mayamaea pseudoterrestris]|nr:hypothetical protein MPSEU_000414300 [Mayamaea pseudoterrestris]
MHRVQSTPLIKQRPATLPHLSPLDKGSEHESASESANTTATANSSSNDSCDGEKRMGSKSQSSNKTSSERSSDRDKGKRLSSHVDTTKKPNGSCMSRRSSYSGSSTSVSPKLSDDKTLRASSGSNSGLSKSEHHSRKSSRPKEQVAEGVKKSFSSHRDVSPLPTTSSHSTRKNTRPSKSPPKPSEGRRGSRLLKSSEHKALEQQRRSRSKHRSTVKSSNQDLSEASFHSTQSSDHTSVSPLQQQPQRPSFGRQGSYRRRRSRSCKRNTDRSTLKANQIRPNVRRTSIGRAPALYQYEYDQPVARSVVQEKHQEGPFQRRMRRHSLSASVHGPAQETESEFGSPIVWNEEHFDDIAPVVTERRTQQRRRASIGAFECRSNQSVASDTRSVHTIDSSMPEASLFEIMQRVGIACTKAQVDKLERLGVTIQRK